MIIFYLHIVSWIFRNIHISFRLLRNTVRHINTGGVSVPISEVKKLRLGTISSLHKIIQLISGKDRMECRLFYSLSMCTFHFISIFVEILSPWARIEKYFGARGIWNHSKITIWPVFLCPNIVPATISFWIVLTVFYLVIHSNNDHNHAFSLTIPESV